MVNAQNSSQIRQNNIKMILSTIIDNGPVSKRELQKLTGLSWGAVSSLSSLLIENRLVIATGKQVTSKGRKPDELDVNRDDNYVIGIDLNLNGIYGVVTDLKGRIIKEWFRLIARLDYHCVMDTVLSLLDEIILKEFPRCRIFGIGLAVQGIVNVEDGVSVYLPQIHNWSNVPMKKIVEERFKLPTFLMHDPNCLMIAERMFGTFHHSSTRNALLIRIDNGIGMSLMIDGQLYLGDKGMAGEFGHIPVQKDGPLCVCGKRGCLEEFASGNGLVHRFVELVNQGKTTSANLSDVRSFRCRSLARAAQQGDELCRGLFSQLGEHLGMALSCVVNVLNPESVVLYGDLTKYRDLFFDEMKKALDDHVYGRISTNLIFSQLGDNAVAQGAAVVASGHWVETLNLSIENSFGSDS